MGLEYFIAIMWFMVLAVSAFLVFVVGPIDHVLGSSIPRIIISVIQAAIAIGAVILLVISLSKLKRAYANRRLAGG